MKKYGYAIELLKGHIQACDDLAKEAMYNGNREQAIEYIKAKFDYQKAALLLKQTCSGDSNSGMYMGGAEE
jgi:hypothetical protein